jgi:hypothetical protein
VQRAEELRAHFAGQGWDVHVARSGCETRRLAGKHSPAAVVLVAEPTQGESGWLTCGKLLLEKPHQRVVLLGDDISPESQRRAAFVGAAVYLPVTASAAAVESAVLGSCVPSRN